MRYNYWFAKHYLKGKHSRSLSGANYLSVIGIALGVFALLIVLSVMNGFDSDMMERIVGTKADIRIFNQHRGPINNPDSLLSSVTDVPHIIAAAPVIRNELMLLHGNSTAGTVSFGIRIKQQRNVSRIFDTFPRNGSTSSIQRGIFSGVASDSLLNKQGILLGMDLAMQLQATVGDTIMLVSPLADIPTALGLIPRSVQLVVNGILVSGMPEYDRTFSYTSMQVAADMRGSQKLPDYIELKTDSPLTSRKISSRVQKKLGSDWVVEDWSQFDSSLYNAMRLEKFLMFTILCLMILIASFNMSGHFLKLVVQKRRELGILKALGATEQSIRSIFRTQGLILGFIGTITGVFSSLAVLLSQLQWHWLKIPVGNLPTTYLPVRLEWGDFIVIPIASMMICLLSTWYPAMKTKAVVPIKIIRERG